MARYTAQGGWTLRALSKMAETFFLSYLWTQYVAVYVLVPFFLTGVIAGEREQKTLDLLFTTQLGNREIVFGKLGSRVVMMIMLILSGVPIVAITMLFGGVNAHTFVYALISTMLALLYTSSMAIYFSTTTKTTLGALVRTYWWLLCWILILPLVLGFCMELLIHYAGGMTGATNYAYRLSWQEGFLVTIALLNPVAPFVLSSDSYLVGQLQRLLGPWYFFYMLIIPTLWSILMITLAIWNVRKEPATHRFVVNLRKVLSTIVGWLVLKPLTSRLLKILPRSKPDRWLWFPVKNPFWQRARRAWVYDREQHLQRAQLGGWILAILILVLLASLESGFFRDRESGVFFVMWIWMGMTVITCVIAGTCLATDRRRGFFEFVLVTPLEHWEVILGTFLACWRHVKKLYMLLIVMTVFFVLTGKVHLFQALLSLLVGTLLLMLMMLQGIVCSLSARSVATALIAAFAWPAVVMILTPMFYPVFRSGGGPLLWILCLILLPASWLLSCWRKNAFTVAFLQISLHMSLVSLATFYLGIYDNYGEVTILSVHPGFMTLNPMIDVQYGPAVRYGPIWSAVVILYCTAVLINMVWLLWWCCRHYEVLSGRQEKVQKRVRNPVSAVSLQAVPLPGAG